MRTKNLFRSIVAATLAVVSMSAFAQLTTTGAATAAKNGPGPAPANVNQTEVVDFATIGSIMPYSVTRDADVEDMVADDPASFLPSVFNWRISGGGTFQQVGGLALTSTGTPNYAGYYDQNDVQVTWGAAAGEYDITVSERSRNTLGIAPCDGGDSTIRVYLMPRPTIDWDEANFALATGTAGDNIVGGCGIASTASSVNINIPVQLTSYTQDMKIAYSYQKYTMAGALDGAAVTQSLAASANYGTDSWFTASPASPNTETSVTLVTLTLPQVVDAATRQAAYGKWEFTITAVNDIVSRKSGIVSQAADIPAGIFTLYSLPTPTTGTVRHVTNAGW